MLLCNAIFRVQSCPFTPFPLMANIAKLAIKLVADMENAQKEFSSISKTISSIERSAKTATPSMNNLTDAVKGMQTMQGAVQKAVEIGDLGTLEKAKHVCDELKSTVQTMGEGVGEDILKMKPTISNVQKAQKEVEKLLALQKEMGAEGHLLDSAIQKAQMSMAELGNQTMQAKMEANLLKSALIGINSMPFMILSSLFADLLKNTKEWGGGFNTTAVRAVAVTGSLVIALGLAGAKMTALGVSTSYFVGLWKSSIIYQGLSGVITLLNTILGTQIAITAATVAWTAAATLGISVVVGAVAMMVAKWFDNSAAIDESNRSIEAMEKATQKVLDRWKQLQNVAKNALESLMTPAEKLVNKLNELKEAQKAPDKLKEELKNLANRQQRVAGWIANDQKNGGWFADTNLQKQHVDEFNAIQKNMEDLNAALKEQVKITDEQVAAAWKKDIRDQLNIESPAEKLKERMELLNLALQQGAINQQEYAAAVQAANEQWDPATKAAIEQTKAAAEATKKLAQEQERAAAEFRALANKFKTMGKTPVESFKELSVDLRRVQAALTPAEFKAATNKLRADLANGLGIASYLKDAATPAQQLAETYKKLEMYAREANLSSKELTAAKNRAKEALEKQSEYYSLYQKAQDAMLTTQEKLNRELTRISEEAKQWGWDKSVVAKMKELKTAELLGEQVREQQNTDSGKSNQKSNQNNSALEYGTVAYYEAQHKNNDANLKENKIHTKLLMDITKNTRQNTGKTQPYVVIG